MTFEPISLSAGTYSPGLPAPVVMTGTRSSRTTCMTSLTNGLMSITLTPKGLSVHPLTF